MMRRIISLGLLALALLSIFLCSNALAVDLNGVWNCDNGGIFYIRQIEDIIWWYGEEPSLVPSWTNVAFGRIDDNTVSLFWADVPKGHIINDGILVLQVVNPNEIIVLQETGGFNGSKWWKGKYIGP